MRNLLILLLALLPSSSLAQQPGGGDDKPTSLDRAKESYQTRRNARADRGDQCAKGEARNTQLGVGGKTDCTGDSSFADTVGETMGASNQLGTIGASIAGKAAEADAIKANGDQHRIMRQHADTLDKQGKIQTALGAGQLLGGIIGGTIVRQGHGDGTLEATGGLQDRQKFYLSEQDRLEKEAATAEAAGKKDEAKKLYVEAESASRKLDNIEDAIASHKQTANKGWATMVKGVFLGGQNLAGGLMSIKTAGDERDAASKLAPPDKNQQFQPITPTDSTNVTPPTATPVVNAQPIANEIQAAPADTQKEDKSKDDLIPPPLLGRRDGGGLAGPAPPVSGGVVNPAQTSGGGGGGGGSGGGGGLQAPEDSARGSDAEAVASNNPKFDAASSGAGGGFASTAGGGSKRMGDTGMDLNGLLAQFLPKNGEDQGRQPASSILDLDGNAKRKRSGAAAGDDGTVLGKEATFWPRIHKVMAAYYQKGELLQKK